MERYRYGSQENRCDKVLGIEGAHSAVLSINVTMTRLSQVSVYTAKKIVSKKPTLEASLLYT
jgi:hypothetical protein